MTYDGPMTKTRTRALLAAMASAMLMLGYFLGLHAQVQEGPTAESCARQLGIHYTFEDGVTEHLTDFNRCMLGLPPLGVALQIQAGSDYEVILDPMTGIYRIEPR